MLSTVRDEVSACQTESFEYSWNNLSEGEKATGFIGDISLILS